jgi:hypothetical protein
MVIFVENMPAGSWRRQIVGYLLSVAVGLGLAFALRRSGFPPATRILLSSLPTWFVFALASPNSGPTHSIGTRLMRAGAYSLVVSTLMYALARLAI